MNKSVIFGICLVLASCGLRTPSEPILDSEDAVAANPSVETVDEGLITPIPQQRPIYRATESILTDLIHTKLEVNFDWAKSRMNGVATITAKPHFYASNKLILDAKGMLINSVKMEGKSLQFVYENDLLTIDLGQEYKRTEQYTVVIDYVARPEERTTSGSDAISSDKGLYFINPTGENKEQMPQIWTQGETEASSVWFPTIDQPNAKTTQEIFITVDEKYETLSNGKLISSKKLGNGKRVDHWKQELPHAPYLFMMGVGQFKVVKDTYTRPDGSKMDVHYYVEPEWEGSARAIFGETPEMIRFFSKLTGVEYPWDKYHQIVVREYVSGAMENTGAVIFGDYVYKNERELLDENDQSTIAHELFHHWFGDLVTCESWSNLPLNESFANYSQYLWDEHRYGLDQADYYAIEEADGYYQSAAVGGYHNLIWLDYDDKEQMFDGHSYNKGGRILHMLRNYLGDEAFFEGMKNYLQTNKFKPAEFHQLRIAFEEVSGEDLNWFFDQWFLGAGHPVLEFNHTTDAATGLLQVTIKQNQDTELSPIYKLPMEIAYWDNDGKHVEKIVVDKLEEKFSFKINGDIKGLIYDHQQMLLARTSSNKTTGLYVHQFYNGVRYAARLEGLMLGSRDKSSVGQQLILDALNDPFWAIREEAIKKMSLLKEEYKEKGVAKLKELVVKDPTSSVRAAAIGKLASFVDEPEANEMYAKSIHTDSSYTVVTSALTKLGKNDPEKAISLAEGLEKEKSSKMMTGIAQVYAVYGDSTKFTYLKSAVDGNVAQGLDKLGLLGSFTYFVARQDVDIAARALSSYEKAQAKGDFYMKMFLPQNIAYLLDAFAKKENELNRELAMHEENGDTLYADQTRRKLKKLKEVVGQYYAFGEKVKVENEEKSSEGH